ncbi:MAG: hypothetical protein QOD86_1008 [Miltoncostaeaceae bacterium]|nr:hypothetical protein [Miltoncostaeaceae bacterium]
MTTVGKASPDGAVSADRPRAACDLGALAEAATHLLATPVAALALVPAGAAPAAADPAEALCRRLLAASGGEAIEDLTGDAEALALGAASFLAAPTGGDGATLCVLGADRRAWSATDLRRLASLAAALSVAPPLSGAGERRWREILREAPIAVSVLRGPDHRIEYVNDVVERLFGRRHPVGHSLRELDPELARQGLFEACDRVYATGRRYEADELPVLTDPSGAGRPEETFFNVICQPIRGDGGAIDGVLAVGVDVTEQVRARREAERAADRLARLQRVSSALASALTPQQVGEVVVTEGLAALGATAGIVTVLDEDAAQVVSAVGYPESLIESIRRFGLDAPIPLATALREGEPLWLESEADWMGRWPAPTSGRGPVGAAVPLHAEGRIIGAVGLRFDADEHTFEQGERDFILTLTRLCAQAMERARLYAAEQRARALAERAEQRARLLAEVSLAVDAPVGVEERLKSLARLVVPDLGDYCTVRLVELTGDARLAATSHVDPLKEPLVRALYGRHYSPDVAVGPAQVIRTGRPGLIKNVSLEMLRAYAPDEDFMAGMVELGPISYLCVPLTARGRVLGALSLMTAESGRHFDRDDLHMLTEIGRRAGLALDNARLYEAELAVATTLQEALLPERLPEVAGLELAWRYVASSEPGRVGGDWYDAIALDDRRLMLCVGDVVGRGPQAAAVMGQLRAALNVLVREGLSPGAVLGRMSRVADRIPGARTTTAAVCLVDLEADEATYACAGHPPPLLLRADGTAALLWEGRSPPLGVGDQGARPTARVALLPGDGLLLYTDGLVERRGEPLDSAFARLAEAAAGAPDERPSALCGRVLETMVPAGAAEDDVALLVARRGGAPAFEMSLPARAAELATLRAGLRGWLAEVGADEEEVADIVLACDEAAANAIEHAYLEGPVREMSVIGTVGSDGLLRLEVRDAGRWRGTPAPGDRGRGIPLMRALMDRAEVVPGAEGCAVRMSRRLRRDGGGEPPGSLATMATASAAPSHARLRDLSRAAGAGPPRASARLVGEVDHASVPELARRLTEAVQPGDELTLDLTEVTFLDSAGVRMLVDLARRLAPPAGRLRLLLHPASAPRRTLALSGVDRAPGVSVEESGSA